MTENPLRSTGQVLSIGEVLIDLIASDDASSLESADSFAARPGGAPANVAVALARLGIASAFCGVVGCDPFGTRLKRDLAAENVDTAHLSQSERAATALAFAWKDSRGDGHFWLLRGADTTLSMQDVDGAGIHRMAALVVGSVSLAEQPSRDAVMHAVALARQASVPVVFDVNFRPTVWANPLASVALVEEVARESQVLKLSVDDASGLHMKKRSPEETVEQLLAHGPGVVVLTDGERGCWFGHRNQPKATFVPAFAVQSLEPTGAGDAFCAALIARSLDSNWAPLSQSDVRYAAAAGALATTARGAWDGLPTRQQLDAFVASQ